MNRWQLFARYPTLIEAQHAANLLEVGGFCVQVRNDLLAGALGEIPHLEAWPQLWLLSAHSLDAARCYLECAQQQVMTSPWICAQCGEALEAQFTHCWQCGWARIEQEL